MFAKLPRGSGATAAMLIFYRGGRTKEGTAVRLQSAAPACTTKSPVSPRQWTYTRVVPSLTA